MVEAIGLNVVNLHRVSFGGIKLRGSGLSEGDWLELEGREMEVIQLAIEASKQREADGGEAEFADEYEEWGN